MLLLLFTAVFLLPVFAGIGKIPEKFFGEISGISMKITSGIVSISVVLTIAAFFSGLNIFVEIITIFIGLISFFYFKLYQDFWSFFSKKGKLFLPLVLVISFAGSFFPFILDYFGYYLPTVKWISEYGLVKGVSNLDILLGQMSFWHIFQAGFSHFSDPFLRMNSLVLIIYLIYILEKEYWIHLVFLPFLFLFSQSPSPDLPAIVFSMIILNEIFSGNHNQKLLLAFSAMVFAIKPTMIWLPLFVFLYGIFVLKSNLRFLIPGSLVLILFFAKNIWCFGFPIFPVQLVDFGISWKPNPEILQISSKVAIEKTFDTQHKYAEIMNFSTLDYLKNWLFLKGIKSKIHILFIASLLAFSVFTFRRKNKIITLLYISVIAKSILVLVFSAQYRFFMDAFFVVFFVMLYQKVTRKQTMLLFSGFSIFFLCFLSFPGFVKKVFPSFKLGQFILGFQKTQWYEPSYFEWNKYKTYQIGNLKFNVVENYPFSFDIPIPAISPEFLQENFDAGIFPQQNSENIKDGYYWRKMNDKEKKQLKNILEEIHSKTN